MARALVKFEKTPGVGELRSLENPWGLKLRSISILFGLLLGPFLSPGFSPLELLKGSFPTSRIQTLQTDHPRTPLIFIPGLAGSRMENDPDQNGVYGEVWPNGDRLILDPWDTSLLALRLAPNGVDPFLPEPQYTSVRPGDIIREEYGLDIYGSTIAYFTGPTGGYVEGEDFFVCPYDWRKDLEAIAFGPLPLTLDRCIQNALSMNPGSRQVNILAHSMGGLVSRVYLTDPLRAANVKRLVTLGTPFLGAPKMFLALIDRLCFAEWLGLCFSNPDVLHELIQNYPAGYQIAPGETYHQVYADGYLRRDRDADGDGKTDGYLDPGALYRLLEAHNPELARRAVELYKRVGGWSNGGTNGVEVYSIAGDGFGTIGTIVEYETRPWYNPWSSPVLAYRSEATNGDGTVPLHSADLRGPERQVDLSGGVRTIYFNLDHVQLAQHPDVLQLAAELFDSPTPADLDGLLQAGQSSQPGTRSPQAPAVPHTEPRPLDGLWLNITGPVQVEVLDSTGRRTGRAGEQGQAENGIPGASYDELGSTFFIFLPDGGSYEVRLYGLEQGTASVRLQKIAADQVVETHVTLGLPIEEPSLATLPLTAADLSGAEFVLDQNGDGVGEGTYGPTAILDAQESLDTTAPRTSITLEGPRSADGGFTGAVTVTLEAADGPQGTGVALIEYSLDGGRTVQRYSGPFQVDPQSSSWIIARAADRAGNVEPDFVFARVGPVEVFLPGLLK